MKKQINRCILCLLHFNKVRTLSCYLWSMVALITSLTYTNFKGYCHHDDLQLRRKLNMIKAQYKHAIAKPIVLSVRLGKVFPPFRPLSKAMSCLSAFLITPSLIRFKSASTLAAHDPCFLLFKHKMNSAYNSLAFSSPKILLIKSAFLALKFGANRCSINKAETLKPLMIINKTEIKKCVSKRLIIYLV